MNLNQFSLTGKLRGHIARLEYIWLISDVKCCAVLAIHAAGSEKDLQQKEAKLMELQESYETRLLQHKV